MLQIRLVYCEQVRTRGVFICTSQIGLLGMAVIEVFLDYLLLTVISQLLQGLYVQDQRHYVPS
jgi:hypothetical protein